MKILFFDEGLAESTREYRVSLLANSCCAFSDIAQFHTKLSDHFDFLDNSGNDIKVLFNEENIDFVFIHHSFDLPSSIPSNCFEVLRERLKGKLITFSGDTFSSIEKGALRRDDVYSHFKEFIEIYMLIKEWHLKVFTDPNCKRSIAEYNFELFRHVLEDELSLAFKTTAFTKICTLLQTDSAKLIIHLSQMDESSIIEFLETKINNL